MSLFERTPANDFWLRALLMAAAFFAVGSVGFFLAVFLEHPKGQTAPGPSSVANTAPVSSSIQHAAQSTTTATAISNPKASASTTAPAAHPAPAASGNPEVTAKLKALENFNGQ